jgi:hypothetical protein
MRLLTPAWFGLLSALLAAAGCNRQSAPETMASQPPAPSPVLQLSKPEVTLKGLLAFHCKVSYRITQGQPQPGRWYTLMWEAKAPATGTAFVTKVEAKDLKTEGVLEGDCTMLPQYPVVPGGVVELAAYEGLQKDASGWKPISNTVATAAKI